MSSYLSLLGISTIDNVVGNQINAQNIITQSLTDSSLTSGIVSSTSNGTLQNSLVGTGLNYNSGTNILSNTGVTSISSGLTGPVSLSSSTGAVTIWLPQDLQITSSPNFTNLGILNNLIIGSTSNTNSLLAASAGYVVNAISNAPLNYDNTTSTLSISLTGSTGINYNVIGSTGYISSLSITGPTGPTGAGGTIGYYANYYSTTTQTVNLTATQITFPNNFVQNGISLDANSNIVFSSAGTYKITTLLQVNGSNNSRFHHWYRYNGVDVPNSAFEDHFSSGAGQVLSTSSGLITVNAGDTLGLWGLRRSGTISIEYTPGSVSPVYPASTSVNVVVSQETYTQIGPTGPTGPTGPGLYTAGSNINIASNVISTVTNPQFERVLNSTLGNRTILLGTNSGSSFTSGGTDCVAVGHNTLNALTTGGSSTACGSQSLRYVTTGGSNTACGFNSLNALQTGSQNTAVGAFSGSLMTTGRFNTLVGMSAGGNLTTGDTNFHLGLNSGFSNLSSNDNISIGAYSMGKAANFMTGVNGRNLSIGHYSGHSLSGQPTNNVAIGYQALWNATEVSDNIAIGTNSLATIRAGGGANIAIGGSSTSVGGTLTNGQGYNIGLGIASNLYISGNASNNIGIGAYSNFNTSTGTNNISIGPFTQASSATSSNEITISTNGTISVPVSGRGANTALIDARNGLYSYSPAYWWGYADNHTGGIITWFAYSDRKGIALKVGDRTQLLLPFIGLYEIALSGNIYVGAVSQNLDVYVNGSLYLQNACFFQTITGWTACSLNVIVPAYTVNTYVQFTLSGSLGTATSIQLFLKAKFLSLM